MRWAVPSDSGDAADARPGESVPALRLEGDLTLADVATVRAWLDELPTYVRAELHLADADLPEGMAMAALVRVVADRLGAGGALHLDGPPQLLLHNLYRIGRHPHILLSVTNERHEEAYG